MKSTALWLEGAVKRPIKTGVFDLRSWKAVVLVNHQCGDMMIVSSDKPGIFQGPGALMASFPSSSLPPHADVNAVGIIVNSSVVLFLILPV